jgi:hypothetical protein
MGSLHKKALQNDNCRHGAQQSHKKAVAPHRVYASAMVGDGLDMAADFAGNGHEAEDGGRRTEDGGRRTEDGERMTDDG